MSTEHLLHTDEGVNESGIADTQGHDTQRQSLEALLEVPKITMQEALDMGFVVDTNCYPWFAYIGPRFSPLESCHVYTDLESALINDRKDRNPCNAEGTWLWCKFMDFCKGRRVSPAGYNDLFQIAGEAHELYVPPIDEKAAAIKSIMRTALNKIASIIPDSSGANEAKQLASTAIEEIDAAALENNVAAENHVSVKPKM